MAAKDKSELYRELKEAGYEFKKHYREYTIKELEDISATELSAGYGLDDLERDLLEGNRAQDPNELPTQRRGHEDEIIRVDEAGNEWYQEEIIKEGSAKPRGYRIHRELTADVEEVKITDTDQFGTTYTETIEVAGSKQRPMEARVGIPTWQVGIYRSPQFRFARIVKYRDRVGFLREDIDTYFGGEDVIPEGVKRIHVGNLICYDMKSVTTAIQREHNTLLRRGLPV